MATNGAAGGVVVGGTVEGELIGIEVGGGFVIGVPTGGVILAGLVTWGVFTAKFGEEVGATGFVEGVVVPVGGIAEGDVGAVTAACGMAEELFVAVGGFIITIASTLARTTPPMPQPIPIIAP